MLPITNRYPLSPLCFRPKFKDFGGKRLQANATPSKAENKRNFDTRNRISRPCQLETLRTKWWTQLRWFDVEMWILRVRIDLWHNCADKTIRCYNYGDSVYTSDMLISDLVLAWHETSSNVFDFAVVQFKLFVILFQPISMLCSVIKALK